MAISRIVDVTDDFNADSQAILEVGGYDYIDVQLVTPTGAVNFENTNDSGAITGVSDGSAASAINFVAVQGTNLGTGSAVTSLNASGVVKFNGIAQFFRLIGTGVTVTKALVRLYKIN